MRTVLHLVRRPQAARALPSLPLASAATHWIVELCAGTPELLAVGAPPLAPGSLTFDQLHQLICAADVVIAW